MIYSVSCGLQGWIEKEIQASPAAPAPLSTHTYRIPLCTVNLINNNDTFDCIHSWWIQEAMHSVLRKLCQHFLKQHATAMNCS